MTRPNNNTRRPRGFTLIELLTVVAIISLLISILLPSLSRARDQAKRAKIQVLLDSIGKSLEMFHNDFGEYPDSSRRQDAVSWDVTTTLTDKPMLSGAHWLARALVGHDRNGIDNQKLVMQGYTATMTRPLESTLKTAARKGAYFEGNVFFRDNDDASGLTTGTTSSYNDFTPTGRMIVVDDLFKSPILYYRANERASEPFCIYGTGANDPGSADDRAGIYRQLDNIDITGNNGNIKGWDFGNTFKYHQIAPFGTLTVATTDLSVLGTIPTGFINTFVNYFKNGNALKSSAAVKPVNPDRFILLSAGKDGVYGTNDDIGNFNQ